MLDFEVVNQYDADIYQEAINIFLEDTVNVLKQISECDDLESQKKLAHRLKGACLMIGARACAESAQKIEYAVDQNSLNEGILGLKNEHAKLIDYLLANYQ